MIPLTEETPTWFQCRRNTPGRDDTLAAASSSSFAGAEPSIRRNPPDVVQRYRALGEKIYQHEVALSKQQSAAGSSAGSGRDQAWVESTMRRGTLKDRVAAMSVVVSTHPVHKLHALDMLLNMVGINIDRHSGQVTGSFQPYFRASSVPSLPSSQRYRHGGARRCSVSHRPHQSPRGLHAGSHVAVQSCRRFA